MRPSSRCRSRCRCRSYTARCRGWRSTVSTCSCFGGSSVATASLVRRSMSGRMRRRSVASRSASPSRSMGLAHCSLNAPGRRVQPRRDDRQQRPEVHQRVLERRAGDGELRPGREPPHRLVGLGLVVLDELRLVEHHRAPRRAERHSASSIRATVYEVMTTCGPVDGRRRGCGGPCRACGRRRRCAARGRSARPRRPRSTARRWGRRRAPGGRARRARGRAAPSRASARSCRAPCRRRAPRRARSPTAATATGSPRPGTAAAWRRARPAPRPAARSPPSTSRPTVRCHRALCSSTTPSAASSSQSPTCTAEMRSGSDGLSCSERASSTSRRSVSSSGRSRANHVPESRMRCSCPRATASMSGARGTSSPATVTEMPRSNQSVAAPEPPPASLVDTWMSGASSTSV